MLGLPPVQRRGCDPEWSRRGQNALELGRRWERAMGGWPDLLPGPWPRLPHRIAGERWSWGQGQRRRASWQSGAD